MAPFPGFAGGMVIARSPQAADELTINLWPCTVPSQAGKSQKVLYGVPGSAQEVNLGTGQPVRGLFAQDGRCGAVSGDGFFERLAPGTWVRRGTVAQDTAPAIILSNGTAGLQWMIISGGKGYVFTLSTNAFAAISDADFPANVVTGGFLDGYGLILTTGGSFYISALNNFTSWDAADVGTRNQASDTLTGMLVVAPKLWLFGHVTSEPWYDNGASDFPFAPVPEAFLHVGLAARHSVAVVSGTPCWLGQDRAGIRCVYAATSESSAQPVSGPIAPLLTRLQTVSDAIGWAETYDEHPHYVLTFPTEQLTVAFDLAEQQWHQRAYWRNGQWEAWRSRCHAVHDGQHLTGSRETGIIYRQSLELFDDAGDDLRWVRQPPRVWVENRRLFHQSLELHAEPGTAPEAVTATVDLEWSNDGGQTWGHVHQATTGKQGQYGARTQWQRLGAARDRVYRWSGTAPVRRALIDVSIALEQGAA